MYIYIYIERERERERVKHGNCQTTNYTSINLFQDTTNIHLFKLSDL